MKLFTISVKSLMALGLLALSCSRPVEQNQISPVKVRTSAREKAIGYEVQIAKILAKAVANEKVREIIVKQAVKQFDNDYDVLYQIIKNEKIDERTTFEEYLESLAPNKETFEELIFNLPLLTFYIPTGLPAEKWNTKSDVPFVAVRNEEKKLLVFNKDGDQDELNPLELPILPLVVVKTNERVSIDTQTEGGRLSGKNFILGNGTDNFYFADDVFNNVNPIKNGGRYVIYNPYEPIFDNAFQISSSCGTCTQRDYIYYGISNTQPAGTLSNKFEEAITQIEFENIGVLNNMGGWDEGNFEIRMHGIFGRRNSSTNDPVSRNANIRGEDLFLYHDELRHRGIFGVNTYWVRITDGVKPYKFSTPVTFGRWDMEELGDKYIFDLEEYDIASTSERTYKTTNSYGFNFSINAGNKEKLGASLGANGTTTRETTTVVKSTTESLPLGSFEVYWWSPVFTSLTLDYLPTGPMLYGHTLDRNTASIKVSVETVRVQP